MLILKFQKSVVNAVHYFILSKKFNKDEKICDICFDILADARESGQLYIVWTDNQKFRVFTNLY